MIPAYAEDPVFLATLFGIIGLAVGSFLNVVVYRLPRILEREWRAQCAELRGEALDEPEPISLAFPGSRCPHCAAPIRPTDNVPLLSYLLLRGRCRHCGAAISLRYPAIEVMSALACAFAAWHFGFSALSIAACVFIWSMIALAFIDLDTQLLPDDITLPLLWCGLLLNVFGTFTDLKSAVIGAAAGYLLLWSVYWLFKLATRKEGMGYGDFKLLAAIGAWLGWQSLPFVVLASSVAGASIGIALMIARGHARNVPIPFGPYLAIAGFTGVFWGTSISRDLLGLPF